MAPSARQEPFMARLIAAFTALLLLAGCESDEDFWAPARTVVDTGWPFGASDTTTTAAATPVNERCPGVAYQRKADAKANGFDDDMQDEVYNRTYAECAGWDRDHTGARPAS
jgi:hypothetical protein